jgi:hypothetical protein
LYRESPLLQDGRRLVKRRESRLEKIREAKAGLESVPMLKEVKAQMGRPPRQVTADNGYFREPNVTDAQLRHKLRTAEGQAVYKLRKAVVEPVFGQIKEARGFRRFLLRGLGKVQAEWQMICATQDLLKLFRSGWSPQRA